MLKELREKLTALLKEADGLIAKDELTDEEEVRSSEITEEIRSTQTKIDAAEVRAKAEKYLDQPASDTPVIKDALDEPNESRNASEVHERILDKEFTFTERCIAVRDVSKGKPLDVRYIKENEERAAQGAEAGIGSDGGFLVGTQSIDINKKVYGNKQSLINYVDVRPVGAGFDGAQWVNIRQTSRKDTYRHGGVIGYYQGEADTVDFNNMKLEDGELKLTELLAIVPATDRLLRDATGFEAMARATIEKEFASQINRGIVAGTGAAMPLGLRNSGAIKSIAKEGGQAADTIVYENIVNMYSYVMQESLESNGLAFIYHPTAFPQLATMAMTVGAGGVPVWQPAGGISGKPYETLFGYPAFRSEFLPEVGNASDIMLVDLNEYLWITKGDIVVDISPHVYFTSNQTLFRFKQAVNGMPKHDSATTLYEGTETVSPYLNIAERA